MIGLSTCGFAGGDGVAGPVPGFFGPLGRALGFWLVEHPWHPRVGLAQVGFGGTSLFLLVWGEGAIRVFTS